MRVYIAGPYSAPTEEQRLQNVRRASIAALELMMAGHDPYVPHLSHYLDEIANERGEPISYEQWMALDLAWLRQCDVLLYLEQSPGADREKAEAERRSIPVAHNVQEVGPAHAICSVCNYMKQVGRICTKCGRQ